jgi:hypothetical protein
MEICLYSFSLITHSCEISKSEKCCEYDCGNSDPCVVVHGHAAAAPGAGFFEPNCI